MAPGWALLLSVALVVGFALIACWRFRHARPQLHAEVGIWLSGGIALLVFSFWAAALLYGRGRLPDSSEDPEWIRSVMTAALPAAGLLGASVAALTSSVT